MAMFDYRRVGKCHSWQEIYLWNQVLRQARIPLHLEGEV